jgi:hypothetical protein
MKLDFLKPTKKTIAYTLGITLIAILLVLFSKCTQWNVCPEGAMCLVADGTFCQESTLSFGKYLWPNILINQGMDYTRWGPIRQRYQFLQISTLIPFVIIWYLIFTLLRHITA